MSKCTYNEPSGFARRHLGFFEVVCVPCNQSTQRRRTSCIFMVIARKGKLKEKGQASVLGREIPQLSENFPLA